MPRFRPSRNHGRNGSQADDDEFEDSYSQTNTESNFSQAETVTGDGPQEAGGDRQSRPMLGFYSPDPIRDAINMVNIFTINRSVPDELCSVAINAARAISSAADGVRASLSSGLSHESQAAKTRLLRTYESELRGLAGSIERVAPGARYRRQPTSAMIQVLTMRLPPLMSEVISAAISGALTRSGMFLAELMERDRSGSRSRPSSRASGGSGYGHQFHRSSRGSRSHFVPDFMSRDFTSGGPMRNDGPGAPMFGESMFGENMFGGSMYDEPGPMPGGGVGDGMFDDMFEAMFEEGMFGGPGSGGGPMPRSGRSMPFMGGRGPASPYGPGRSSSMPFMSGRGPFASPYGSGPSGGGRMAPGYGFPPMGPRGPMPPDFMSQAFMGPEFPDDGYP